MNSLSDYVLVQLIHRCNLVERLNTTLKRRGGQLHWHIAIHKTRLDPELLESFVNRYRHIRSLSITVSYMFSLYLLTDETMSKIVHIDITCGTTASDDLLLVLGDVAERCSSLASIMLRATSWAEDNIHTCNEFFNRFSRPIDFQVKSILGTIIFPVTWNTDGQWHGEKDSPREIQAASIPEVILDSSTVEKVAVGMRSDDSVESTAVTVRSCPKLTTLTIGQNVSIDTFPNTLTTLSLLSFNVTRLKKLQSLQLKQLSIYILYSAEESHLARDLLPPSLTEFSMNTGPTLDFTGTRLQLIWVASQVITDGRVLPPTVTDLVAQKVIGNALSSLKHLKKLGYAMNTGSSVTWPDTLTELCLVESPGNIALSPLLPSNIVLSPLLPSRLKILRVIRSTQGPIIKLPDTWSLSQLTELYINGTVLTEGQLKSLRCNKITSANTEEELKTVQRGAQRLIRIDSMKHMLW